MKIAKTHFLYLVFFFFSPSCSVLASPSSRLIETLANDQG